MEHAVDQNPASQEDIINAALDFLADLLGAAAPAVGRPPPNKKI